MASRTAVVIPAIVAFLLAPAFAQEPVPDPEVVHPKLRVSVSDLSTVKASDTSDAAAAKAAVAIVLSAANKTCDPASQILAVLEANASSRLEELSKKLSSASCLTKSGTVHVNARFMPNISIQADDIIASIRNGSLQLMRWNGVLYVLHGVVYDEHLHNSGKRENVIRQLLLIDPRFSGERRFIAFDREKDDFSQVEGISSLDFVSP